MIRYLPNTSFIIGCTVLEFGSCAFWWIQGISVGRWDIVPKKFLVFGGAGCQNLRVAHFRFKKNNLIGISHDENREKNSRHLLGAISKFNLASRYPDEKLAFYKSVDKATSLHWHKIGSELKKWLENSLNASSTH